MGSDHEPKRSWALTQGIHNPWDEGGPFLPREGNRQQKEVTPRFLPRHPHRTDPWAPQDGQGPEVQNRSRGSELSRGRQRGSQEAHRPGRKLLAGPGQRGQGRSSLLLCLEPSAFLRAFPCAHLKAP